MHKFMRTIGFGGCDSDLEMDKIMRKLAKTASKTAVLERNDHPAAGKKDSQTGGRLETGCQKAWKPLRSRTPGR